jgi:hypothetical protein
VAGVCASLRGRGCKGDRNLISSFRRPRRPSIRGSSLLLYFVSPWLLHVWTHGLIEFDRSLMVLLLAYAAICGSWHIPCILLLATNQHVGLAGWSLAASGLAVLLAWLFGQTWGVEGIAAAMLVSEIFIALVCGYLVHRLLFAVSGVKSSLT